MPPQNVMQMTSAADSGKAGDATPVPALSSGKGGPTSIAGDDFLSRLGQALHDNSSMLMAMGGGMMSGGLGKGFQAGASAAAADDKQQADNASRTATLQALRQYGVPSALAQAAAANPTLLKALSARLFGQ
jgi:hypothetical protein